MDKNTILVFTRYGMGHGPEPLQQQLAVKYLGLILQSGELPARILFYTDGVKLACQGSPVLETLHSLEAQGVDLLLCKTCLDFLGMAGEVRAGIVGGMPDIIEAMQKAAKVISL